MNLHEYQAKRLFAKHGVPIPNGDVASTPAEARAIAEKLGGKVAVKSQVLTGGRGKAGGIKLAKSVDEAEALAGQILGMSIRGFTVHKVLIDELAPGIKQEIYLAVLTDRAKRMNMVMASAEGGMEIEEVAAKTPEKILKAHIDPLVGLQKYQTDYLAEKMNLPEALWKDFYKLAANLVAAFEANDATLTEINPLIITGEDKLLALDGKMSLDDSALYRHPDLAEMRDDDEETPAEKLAREYGLSYIQLEGNVGCMVNGAGLAMTTMDVIKAQGGEPANFLDIGGGATQEGVTAALRIILSDPGVKAILFNVFGGIVRGDIVARGIIAALNELQTAVPMVVRLLGTNSAEGRQILAEANMETAVTLMEAAGKAVAAAKRVEAAG
ncbi:MAG: ADP-forming succinate--CoA ligase subunit beta [Anaerolineales bacterium]|nr:ADP-forming succinate--CoA ligase subunit beta [Anaerolineales bacterium]